MLITAVAFTGTARMRDHWSVCTLYIVGPLIVVSVRRFRNVHNGTSSDDVFFCSTTVLYTRSPDLTCLDIFPLSRWCNLCMKPLWKYKKTSSLELPSLQVPLRTCQESSNGHDNQCTACIQTYRAVPVNTTAVISMLNYLLCKSSLASEIAVRDHMYHNVIYLFSCSLSPVLIWTNSFGTPCIVCRESPFGQSTSVGQAVACMSVTQRARVRSPVGTSFLGEIFSGFFLTCKTNVRKL